MGEPWDMLIRILVEYKLTTNKVREVGKMVSYFKYRSWPLYRWSSNTFSTPAWVYNTMKKAYTAIVKINLIT